MSYDLDKLRELARANLAIAQENLKRDGFVQTCGLVWTHLGLSHIVSMRFESLDEKRHNQEAFRVFLRQSNALAAAVIMEAWLKQANSIEPLDFTKSIENMPGRQDAIVLELRSALASFGLVQVFCRNGSALIMEEPIEIDHPTFWTSEWLDGVWADSQISQIGTVRTAS